MAVAGVMGCKRFLLLALASTGALAQTPSAEVKKFIAYDDAVIALTHVRVIDGTGSAAQENRTVVLRGGKIASIADAATTTPDGARVIELAGHSVVPGLVGMHDHLMYTASINFDEDDKIPPPGFLVTELAFSAPRLYLASGVTTMRTTGSIEPYTDLNIRHLIDDGKMPGPHIDVSGPYLEGKDSFFPQMAALTEPEQARKTVAFWAGQGVTSFKAYMNISEAVLGAAIKEAHHQGMKITGHLCAVDYRQAAALGIDDLEHGPLYTDSEFVPDRPHDVCPTRPAIAASWEKREIDSAPVQELIRDLVKHNVALTSTLPVFEASITTRPVLSRRQTQMMSAESLRSYLSARNAAATKPESIVKAEAALKKEMAFELAFVRAGGLLLAGPDPTGNGGVLPGFGDQREVELLVEAGFTPTQAIQIATANGARFEKQLDRIGTIETGKQADLVVLKGDPSRKIQDIENVELVFKDGVAYDPAKLMNSVRGMVGIR
ncbi:MAG: amidohydrolase family protein [Rudaea sp.]|nr:amidohydrolase family protein [Rudaea sp.]